MAAAAVSLTAVATHEIYKEAKRANKQAKELEEAKRKAAMAEAKAEAAQRRAAAQVVPVVVAPSTGPLKPVITHVNIMSTRIQLLQPGVPKLESVSIFFDQALGGWRVVDSMMRSESCTNRKRPHSFMTMPHYIAFGIYDVAGQPHTLFSDASCTVCGEHRLLTSSSIPYQQVVAMSHPQICNEAGFMAQPPGVLAPPPSMPQLMQPPVQPQTGGICVPTVDPNAGYNMPGAPAQMGSYPVLGGPQLMQTANDNPQAFVSPPPL